MRKEQKSGIVNLVKSVFAVGILVLITFVCLMALGYCPLLTNSVSFDAKIAEAEKHDLKDKMIFAIGSSITLNNLNSAVINDSVPLPFYNLSAFGLQMNDIEKATDYFTSVYQPKYILICSSVQDFRFEGNTAISDYFSTSNYVKENWKQFYYFKNFNPISDIIFRNSELRRLDTATEVYNSLKFDPGGGVPLSIAKQNIDQLRWNYHAGFPTKYTSIQYLAFQHLVSLMRKRNIRIIFIQSPVRQSYRVLPDLAKKLNHHVSVCQSIVENGGGVYFDFSDSPAYSNDSLFVDQFHLSATGAIRFTKEVCHVIKPWLQQYYSGRIAEK